MVVMKKFMDFLTGTKNLEEKDFSNLEHDSLESKVTKHISYVPSLFMSGKLMNKNLRIDDELSAINNNREKHAILFFRKYIRATVGRINFPGTCFLSTKNSRGVVKEILF